MFYISIIPLKYDFYIRKNSITFRTFRHAKVTVRLLKMI